MEKKVYILENLGCANCAAKMEAKFNAHPEVEEAIITFSTRQLRLTAENPDSLIPQLQAIARTVEGEVVIRPRPGDSHVHHYAEGCSCGHHHAEGCGCGHHEHSCDCGHNHAEGCGCEHHDHHQDHHGHDHNHEHHSGEELRSLWMGAGLFLAGLILNALGRTWLSFGLCFAAYLLLGVQVVTTAWKNLKNGHVFDENFLMSLATIGAFCIGEYPEAVGVMLFYRLGEYFEHRAVERSRSQIMAAVDLRPETVNRQEGDSVQVIPAGQAQVGDLLLVRPGDRIPLDAVVVSGISNLDTAPITGEPIPVAVEPGSNVVSGCVNTTGQLTIRVEKPLSQSMVTRILDAVENAAASKPKMDRFITRFSRVYTPVVVAIALATAIVPSVVTGNWDYWVYTALSFLVMSCPCALVLSVPLSFFAGIGTGSKRGILFKGGQSMEALSAVKAVVMDKTGTITRGQFRVQTVDGGQEVLQLCASCQQRSTHPVAQSIVASAREQGLHLQEPETMEEFSGRGIRASLGGRTILCGNELLLKENGVAIPAMETIGFTRVLVAVDGCYAGVLTLSDTVKEGAREAIARLHRRGCVTAMLTGDGEDTAREVAKLTGIGEFYPRLLPQDKLTKLQQIRCAKGAVMFVGDGINDAPVLAGADVGAAMGTGADAAIEAADVVFMTGSVEAIPEALEIAADTRRIAWQNVIFALAVKAIVMVLGLCGYASMWLAVFADSGVAMLCVLNSVRLLYKK